MSWERWSRAVSGGWEDLKSCVTSAIKVILSLHILGGLIKFLQGNGPLVSRSKQKLPQFRLISEFGYDFLLSWCWLVLVLVFLWLTRGSVTLVATEATWPALYPELQLWNWANLLCSTWARQEISLSGWHISKMTGDDISWWERFLWHDPCAVSWFSPSTLWPSVWTFWPGNTSYFCYIWHWPATLEWLEKDSD